MTVLLLVEGECVNLRARITGSRSKERYFYLRDLALHSGQTFLPAGKMMSGHVSTIFCSAFGKHITYTHMHGAVFLIALSL